MKTQFQILLFMICLNLGMGLVFALQLPGTEYVGAENPRQNAEYYESHFNATEIGENWRSNPFYGMPVIGDIFSAFQFFIVNWKYLLDGFPTFITWIGDNLIVDATAKTAFMIIADVLRAIFGVLMAVFIIEFIGGRMVTT